MNKVFEGFAVGILVGLLVPKMRNITALCNRVMSFGEPTKMVFVVRTDLNMGKGKIASQCAHAAIQCYKSALIKESETVKMWCASGQPKIVLKASAEDELLSIAGKAANRRLNYCLIRDAGKTQLDPCTVTVLGIGPSKKQDVDCITSHLKLL